MKVLYRPKHELALQKVLREIEENERVARISIHTLPPRFCVELERYSPCIPWVWGSLYLSKKFHDRAVTRFTTVTDSNKSEYYVFEGGKDLQQKPAIYILYVGESENFDSDESAIKELKVSGDIVFVSGTYGEFVNSRYSPYFEIDTQYVVTDPPGAYEKVRYAWYEDVSSDIGDGLSKIHAHCCKKNTSADDLYEFSLSIAAALWKNRRISETFRGDFVKEVTASFQPRPGKRKLF